MGLISRVSSRTYSILEKKQQHSNMPISGNDASQFSKEALFKQLKESGELARIQAHLRKELIESAWRNTVAKKCDEIIDKEGVENITVDKLTQQVTPLARATVPDNVKQDLMLQVKSYLEANTKL